MPLQPQPSRSKSGNVEARKKAFIAAPLIGTILFLSAVLFTVNLNKIEAAQSARIVNDAYHNRIVSIIEIYRTDLASVFRESVRRNIQEYILDPGWNTLDLKNKDDVSGSFINYRAIRLQRCEGIRKLSQEVVCSLGAKPVDASFGYGIPAWIEVASQKFSFEGIRFRPANPDQMARLNPDRTDSAAVTNYASSCRNLVQDNLFDCQDFADHPGHYQCKDTNGQVLPGCVEGTFFMRVDPKGVSSTAPAGDSQLFAAMPRIEGDDGFGNQVRSGAIGDDVFYLPINLRVFYYDNFALELYDKLAFNSDSSHNPQPGGLVQGICSGSPEACLSEGRIRHSFAGGFSPLGPAGQKHAGDRVATYFLNTAYRNGLNTLKNLRTALPPYERNPATGDYFTQFYLQFDSVLLQNQCLDRSTHLPSSHCKDVLSVGTSLTPDQVRAIPNLDPKVLPHSPPTGASAPAESVAFYSDVDQMHFFVLDAKPEFKVVGSEPNHPSYGMTFYLNPT